MTVTVRPAPAAPPYECHNWFTRSMAVGSWLTAWQRATGDNNGDGDGFSTTEGTESTEVETPTATAIWSAAARRRVDMSRTNFALHGLLCSMVLLAKLVRDGLSFVVVVTPQQPLSQASRLAADGTSACSRRSRDCLSPFVYRRRQLSFDPEPRRRAGFFSWRYWCFMVY